MKQAAVLSNVTGPHQGAQLFVQHETAQPTSALLLFHGRGASAADMLGLSQHFDLPSTMIVVAPRAQGAQWYPQRFLVPREENQPHLDSALMVVKESLDWIAQMGVSPKQTIIGGFSQGACLAADFLLRNPQPLGGVLLLSGGVIGSDEQISVTQWSGDLEHTRIFLGCDTQDFHIPVERVRLTTELLRGLNGRVDERLYSNMGHMVSSDEIRACQDIIDQLTL